MDVIANTTVVSNFASVGRLDILHALLGEVYISTEVYAEIQDGQAEDATFYEGIEAYIAPFSSTGWLRLTSLTGDEELRLFAELPPGIHRGEASCLVIAKQRQWTFLSDDARARAVGRELGVIVSGTLGVLAQAVRTGILPLADGDQVLADMIKAGYRSPYVSLASLL